MRSMDAEMEQLAPLFAAMGLVGMLIGLAVAVIGIIAWCLIFKKAGWSWALGLLMLVPIANLIVFLVLAFAKWPIQRQLEDLQMSRGGPGGGYNPGFGGPLPPQGGGYAPPPPA